MKPTIQDYTSYVERLGEFIPVDEFMKQVDNGDLVKCAVCGVYEPQEVMSEARFSIYEEVCPDCERNGN